MYPSGTSHPKNIWSEQVSPTSDEAFASASLRDRAYLRSLVGLNQVAQPSYEQLTDSHAIGVESRDQLNSAHNLSTNQGAEAIVNSSMSNIPSDLEDISITPFGTIHFKLLQGLRVNLTIDKAIYIYAHQTNTVISFSASGSHAILMHQMGCIYQYGSRVEVIANAGNNNKYAKIWHRGISFTSDSCPDVYLMNCDGVTTRKDGFKELNYNITHNVFYEESHHGPQYIQEAEAMIKTCKHWISQSGTKTYVINNIRISQRRDGMLSIARDAHKYTMTMNPATNAAMMTSNFLHATASMGETDHHLYVRRGVRRIYFDGSSFAVRNVGNHARFVNNSGLLMY